TSTDLAVALAIYSAYKGIAGDRKVLAVGEIGLTGDLRSVQNTEKLAKEAARLGFTRLVLPKKNAERLSEIPKNLKLVPVTNIREAIEIFRS
ncbi:MAG: magnesium chelatase domain-containing protein, partial [Eubacteriales bacterium]|nr:magnesium chelatase domain-containing protein [Eubacteriales bacterium]MDD3350297.1 magnesium chelatase domain-containing protein [Eubacteriales bacterium]